VRVIFIVHPEEGEHVQEFLCFGSISIKGFWDLSFQTPIELDSIGDEFSSIRRSSDGFFFSCSDL
jgi:hypothetical protein